MVLFSLQQYKHRRLIADEISSVISVYKCLTPEMGVYVFTDGTSRNLMNLSGTVRVCYMGEQFNIPVCVWLLDSYPQNPPICFVKPTKDMMIVAGQYTDASGKIDLPYLQDWSYPQTDLFGLIQVMTVVFGEEPPMFLRPTAQPVPAFVQENYFLQGQSQQLSPPEPWRQTEVNSSEESYFTLEQEDEQSFHSRNETSC
ncbi:hypothetical protein AAFF_G00098480 [Aldrovandia affinis]|uniref:UEV domain-containing protein n=1 Tax=Aldrovandia affinis TaxID=143900 RepID=A0AAD7WBT4_9TELE|nr:hypothetical protein AAFF_G00098480 [Aldrovandia affinis]